uniref:Uncharacterized protein LOC111121102 n=1 Tax=Crassostrea virginica TaxID=6565 RepID=A0A8B8CQ81_CRAVI|nr:uncharacterized protein LOC111121102 [Crassostrea virginica]
MNSIQLVACTLVLTGKIYAHVYAHYTCNVTAGICCADHQLVGGICLPCVGSWGLQCTQDCPDGFYGFGCRSKCNCHPNQTCDNIDGCIENRSEDQDKPGILCDILLATSICSGSLCLILIVYILGKRYINKRNKKSISVDSKEQPETLDVEQHSHIVHNCLLEKSTSRSYNQASSSYDRTIHTNQRQTGNLGGNLDGDYSPMCLSQDSFDAEHPISGTPSVCSFCYDKCQINPANYDSSGRKGTEMISVPKQLSKSQILFPSSKMLVEKNSKSKMLEVNGRIYK